MNCMKNQNLLFKEPRVYLCARNYRKINFDVFVRIQFNVRMKIYRKSFVIIVKFMTKTMRQHNYC